METDFEKLSIDSSHEGTPSVLVHFIDIMDVTKRRKESVKILKGVSSNHDFYVKMEKWLCQQLSSLDMSMLRKVSALLELSNTTKDIVKQNFKSTCIYLLHFLKVLCSDEEAKTLFPNSQRFNECCIQTVKLCLQLIQFFPDKLFDLISGKNPDLENRDQMELILGFMLLVLCSKRFTKECSSLSGTSFALLFNLTGNGKDTITSLINLLQYIGEADHTKKDSFCKLGSISINYPDEITSPFASLLIINGFVNIQSHLLLEATTVNELLLDEMFNYVNVERYDDPVSKYLCFQTLLGWMNYLANVGMKDILLHSHNNSRSLFLKKDSHYSNQILNMVWKHIEDLIDGIPAFVQKIFCLLLNLHAQEVKAITENEESNEDHFYIELTRDILKQSWHVKGRWSILTELIPFVTYKQLFTVHPCIANDLIQCMTTCGLTAVSNEVYQTILKDIKTCNDNQGDANNEWASCFSKPLLNALQSDNILLRQNIGQYWIPSTVKILPDCLLDMEQDIRSKLLTDDENIKTNLLHAYILILKSCRNFALIKNNRLEECKSLLSQALQHPDLDIRIETFNTLCCNPKKTEPLSQTFQQMIREFVVDNINTDSSRFRQQMLSSLKKLFMNVRDSAVMLHRKSMREEKEGVTNSENKTSMLQLIDFVEEFLNVTKSCLHPGSLFQRKKSGLLLYQLLSDLFIYVKDEKRRKKGAATDSTEAFFKYLNETDSSVTRKWNILSSMDTELLSCIEDQHDEIRVLALEILNYHQVLSNDHLLDKKETFNSVLNVALSLIDSPRYHETESGAMITKFIIGRLVENESLVKYLNTFQFYEKPLNFQCTDYMSLCSLLLFRGQHDLCSAEDDFLIAASCRPVYGVILALSQILDSLRHIPCHVDLTSFIKELITFCSSVSTLTTKLLSGSYVAKGSLNNDCAEVSPSFADIDEALDITLKNCNSYTHMKEKVGHQHCRELLVSFCWLNLKAISFILVGVSNLAVSVSNDLIDKETFELIYNYYRNSLIKCRHKGVIEGSLSSLTCFSKNLSSTTSYWNEMTTWCFDVLQSAVDLSQNASVTKRSAGIPMFIQAILSAEPATENNELLHKCLKYLLEVAKTELPTDFNVTVDLPQFNAINIMRAIFRDSSLSNSVLPFVEDAVMLTINGFASPSWSIRNASTILLGTLVPRMLGQRISQEENNLQNTSTVEVFFYRYPKLVSYFQNCLDSSESLCVGFGGHSIAPHVIPALTFLSKLSSSNEEECSNLSLIFIPIINRFTRSPVFTIREIATSSIIAFTAEFEYRKLVEETISDMNDEKDNNKIHSSCLILLKAIKRSKNHRKENCSYVVEHFAEGGLFNSLDIDLYSSSVLLDILLECFLVLGPDKVEVFLQYVKNKLSIIDQLKSVCVGKPIFLKSLVNVIVFILGEKHILLDAGHELIRQIESSSCKDLQLYFFERIHKSKMEIFDLHKPEIFHFSLKTIMASNCRIQLESSLACFDLILRRSIFPEEDILSGDIKKIFNRLTNLLNSSFSVHLAPFLLLSMEKLLSYYFYKYKEITCSVGEQPSELYQHNYLTVMCIFARFIDKFSHPEEVEDLRLAAAKALRVLQTFDGLCQCLGNETWQNAVCQVLYSAVRLLQDEDDLIRLEANSSLQFLPYYDQKYRRNGVDEILYDIDRNHSPLVQSNITLKYLIEYVRDRARGDKTYVKWFVDLLIRCDMSNIDETSDLMLFEQEAANLYAEEMVILDLLFESLRYIFTNPFELWRNFHIKNEDLPDILIEPICAACQKVLDRLQYKHDNQSKCSVKSVYGIFGSRKSFITLYKLIKWLLVLHLCASESEKAEISKLYVNKLVSIVGMQVLHPILKAGYDSVVQMYGHSQYVDPDITENII